VGLALMAVGVLAACEQPPLKEVETAERMVEQARQDGAQRLVPDRFNEAEAVLEDARQKIRDRDYRGALRSALDATDRARAASVAAARARTQAAQDAARVRREVEGALGDTDRAAAAARKARVPDRVLQPFERRALEARQRLDGLVEEQDPVVARDALGEIAADVRALPADIERAAAEWEAQQARPRARRRR
jgi:hypothetical protein